MNFPSHAHSAIFTPACTVSEVFPVGVCRWSSESISINCITEPTKWSTICAKKDNTRKASKFLFLFGFYFQLLNSFSSTAIISAEAAGTFDKRQAADVYRNSRLNWSFVGLRKKQKKKRKVFGFPFFRHNKNKWHFRRKSGERCVLASDRHKCCGRCDLNIKFKFYLYSGVSGY
jgi:hypothetical protein